MNRKRALILIIILFTGLFPLIPIPIAKATEATVSIQNSEDDVWMTESGNIFGYESSVRILEPEIGIRSFLRFEDVPLLKSSKINYATLYVYAGFDQGETISPGASVTIYGIDEPDCAPFSYSGRVWSLERPYTSASVNWNVSDWHYSTWKSVNVTSIVKEIINQYAWTQNNSIGFQILGASDTGYEYRTFEDIDHQHHGAYAYLHFHYDTPPGTPPGLPDTAVWVETYGEVDIWRIPGILGGDILDYIFTKANGAYDAKYANLDFTTTISNAVDVYSTLWGGARGIVRLSDGKLVVIYNKDLDGQVQVYVKESSSNGASWTNDIRISTYNGMENYDNEYSAMAVDSNDYLHAVWSGKATGFTIYPQLWYSNYTDSWSTPIRVSLGAGMENYNQIVGVINIDSNDLVHIVWSGGGFTRQIWYTNSTDEFTTQTDIVVLPGSHDDTQTYPAMAIDSENNLHVVWWGSATNYNKVIFYRSWNATTGLWGDTTSLSSQAWPEDMGVICVDSEDDLHVAFAGEEPGFGQAQIWYRKYNGTVWETSIRISNYTGMNLDPQMYPTISVDSTDNINVLWQGKATGYDDFDKIWYGLYFNGTWWTPEVLQPTGSHFWPALQWSRWPEEADADDTFILVDENNTVIENWNGENETDIDDLKDWYDDYVDPGGGDPLDPDPGTQGWDTEGPFTRFNMRLYFLIIGMGCVFGPVWAMAYKKFDSVGYAWCFIVIVLGVGLLWSITGI